MAVSHRGGENADGLSEREGIAKSSRYDHTDVKTPDYRGRLVYTELDQSGLQDSWQWESC